MEQRSRHYNNLKFVTTVLVVLAHASRMYTGYGVVRPALRSLDLANLTKVIYAFHMPLFIAVSGMVYGLCVDDLGKYRRPLPFLGKKARRLLVPYLFFGLFYVAPVVCALGFAHRSYPDCCLNDILLSLNPRHLWFLLVLFEIFVLCAVLRPVFQRVFFAVPLAAFTAAALYADHAPVYFQLRKLMLYLLYFYLGYLLNRYYRRVMRFLSAPWAMVGLLVVARLTYSYRGRTVFEIITAVSAGALMAGLTCYLPERFEKSRFVAGANKNGFGIFLFHPMIIYVIFKYLGAWRVHPLLLCFGAAAAAYFLSWLFTAALRRLRLGVLLGE